MVGVAQAQARLQRPTLVLDHTARALLQRQQTPVCHNQDLLSKTQLLVQVNREAGQCVF